MTDDGVAIKLHLFAAVRADDHAAIIVAARQWADRIEAIAFRDALDRRQRERAREAEIAASWWLEMALAECAGGGLLWGGITGDAEENP